MIGQHIPLALVDPIRPAPVNHIISVHVVDRINRLASFSAAVEAAAESLRESSLAAAYQRYEAFYAQDGHERQEAEAWLALPMDES